MTTTLISFFNSTNIGDRLISNSLHSKLEQYTKIIPFDRSGNNDFKLGYDITPQVNKSAGKSKAQVKERVKKFTFNIAKKINLDAALSKYFFERTDYYDEYFESCIDESDVMILGGGNMVFELDTSTTWTKQFNYYVSYAYEKSIPIIAMSIGIGPFYNDYQYETAIESLKKCDYITFRDYKSYNLFKKKAVDYKNAYVVPDPVFFLDEDYTLSKKGEGIGLNIINPDIIGERTNKNSITSGYVNLIKELINEFDNDIYIFNTEEKDYETCEKIYEMTKDTNRVKLCRVTNLNDLFEVYNNLSLLIGTRMHSLITGFSQNISLIGLSWQPKVEGMFELIEQADSYFRLPDINNNVSDIINLTRAKLEENSKVLNDEIRVKLTELDIISDTILDKIYS